jgi:predicted negative regulator of RcsB-dependent stress response
MAMNPSREPRSFDDATESITDWMQLHSKQLLTGVVAVAVLLGGALVWRSLKSGEAERAEQQFSRAQQPLLSGDVAGAERELRNVITAAGDTPAGVQARLLLAKVLYEQNKYKEGVELLDGFDGDRPEQKAAALSLKAAGLEEQRQFAEAAKAYEEAAEVAPFEADKDNLRASAARAYGFAGNKEQARVIWTALLANENGPLAGEARVRLGELVGPAAGGA